MKFLVVLITTLLSMSAYGRTVTVNLADKDTIDLNGVIGPYLTNPAIDQIHERAGKAKVMTIAINSPGGEIYNGQRLISAMLMAKSRGTKFRCTVTTVAASMAFQILSFCDERLILAKSLLLWHPPRITMGGFGGVSMTPRESGAITRELVRLEKALTSDLLDNLPIPTKLFWQNYHDETLWFGEELVRIFEARTRNPVFEIVDDIKGVDTLQVKMPPSFFGRFMYVCPKTKCGY